MAAARTLSRFGRTYVEFDPDGAGGGPPTWILSSAGAGSGSGTTAALSGVFTPDVTTTMVRAGMALYFKAPSTLDLAVARDAAAAAATVHPYQIAGLASVDGASGDLIGLVTDGQVSQVDWTAICGTAQLDPGKRYYLSDLTPGMLQLTCPTAAGATVVCVGQAISLSTLEVEINLMVRL